MLFLIHWLLMPLWAPIGLFIDLFVIPLAAITLVYLYAFEGASIEDLRKQEWMLDAWQQWVRDSKLYETIWPQEDEEEEETSTIDPEERGFV